MAELVSSLRELSSFAAIWLSTWLLLFGCLYLVYPLIRRVLLRWHPATASNTVLALMALPFCASLLSTLLLFGGLLQMNLVTEHYHGTDCESQFPRLESTWAVLGVLGLSALALVTMLGRFLAHLWTVRALRHRLTLLGETRADWSLLPSDEKLVFTLGWLSNAIFITEGLLKQCSERDLAIILEHERAHARRKDNLRLLLGRLMLLAVPAPLARRLLDDLHLFVEASCDFATASEHGALDVAETLLRVQRLAPERFVCCNRSLISAFTGAEVESRVLLLVEGDAGKRANPIRFWMFLPLLVLLSVQLVDPMHHAAELLLGSIQAAF